VIRHFVTDRRRFSLGVDDLIERAARAAAAGVDVVQIREPDLCDADLAQLVRRTIAAVSSSGTRVLVNDRMDIAVAAGAAGVHLPSDSVIASRVRAVAPREFVIGRSVHSTEEIDRAVADGGCDYLMFGTVFPSQGKPYGYSVSGLEGLRDACARSPLPVIAIGGMSAARASEVEAAGAAGLAAVGLFMYSGGTHG
jgi:thiamine-phosphate pyrophosphorylase